MPSHPIDARLVSLTAPATFAAEQYQGLRLTIERLQRSQGARVIAVSSPGAGDGKTTTAINLAGAFVRGSGGRALLVDADLRQPAVAPRLGLDDGASNGLAEIVAGDCAWRDAGVRRVADDLDVIPAGTPSSSVHRLLRSPRLEQFLAEARESYDIVILDTPPLLPVFDSTLLSRFVDGVIVVVAANQTPRKLLGEALNLLEASKVLGIVFNRDNRPLFGYYDSTYRSYFPDPASVTGL